MLEEFKKFALRGNVVDMAVGFTVGVAFGAIAKSLVDDVIMPVVGLILGSANFSNIFLVLREGSEQAAPYATLDAAKEAGAVTINVGLFINSIVTFLIIAVVMFLVVRTVNRLQEETAEEEEAKAADMRECPYCLSSVPLQASRCQYCTSEITPAIG
jgi:large conductance mechanosensitive channel